MKASALLTGKRGVVFGASSKYSLGLHVAKAWINSGAASVVVACETGDLCDKVEAAGRKEGWWSSACSTEACDVSKDDELDRVLASREVDMVMHSVAYAPTKTLRSPSLLNYGREEFIKSIEISAYSLLAIASRAHFPKDTGGSISALSFHASDRVVPGYGAMAPSKAALETLMRYLAIELGPSGIRVNCISPGPINTPAARAIPNFTTLMEATTKRSPLRRSVASFEVGSTASFLASDFAAAITGQVIRVDCGESITI